ncbi:hypothetical protein JK192_12000 [Gluconobacter cerinus]|uniref:hypothetical protein n=1 Tax=Gluconobacter cerinus TaxID=38307 RepID=UPI001B8B2038|nr:hypothetical protein [Gluconobacter cerinus]MBS1032101.1 hypothetical protein [Gluconobacter cerinus]
MNTLSKYPLALAGLLMMAGCTQMQPNDAIVSLQAATAQMIGLASSDELTVSNVQATSSDGLGGQQLSYTATTVRERVFSRSALMTPGLFTEPPQSVSPHCTPVLVHQ